MPEAEQDQLVARAARIRAARAFADLSQHELAAKLDQSVHTLRRTEQLKREVTLDELVQIGEICEVPEWFMRHGFAISPAGRAQLERQEQMIAAFDRGMKRLLKQAREQGSKRGGNNSANKRAKSSSKSRA
jgi:transcriptional regulator with XRE-family HTH domain